MADSPNDKKFMREKIVKPPINKRRLAGRALCLCLFAVILGVVAAVSFVVSRPMVEKFLGTEPPSTSIPITIQQDSDPASREPTSETMMETTAETLQPEEMREEIEEMVSEAMEDFPWTEKNLQELNEAVRAIYLESEKSIVTVASIRQETDWFDNPILSTGQYAGIILAINPSEVVILTGEKAVEDADSLSVIFGDGSTASVEVKQRDTIAGMAAIRVKTADIGEQTLNWIQAASLGNSYSVRPGDMILAVGSPTGHVHSVITGMISYVAKGVQVADGQTRMLYTDFDGDGDRGVFLLNLSGQLIGWVTEQMEAEETAGASLAMPISEYKWMLEQLSNGVSIPYFGILGQDVSDSMLGDGIPRGVYITESIADGPAYSAGIQSGDILVRFGDQDISSLREFQGCMEETKSGDTVSVVIRRKSIDEYREIEYDVVIGAR